MGSIKVSTCPQLISLEGKVYTTQLSITTIHCFMVQGYANIENEICLQLYVVSNDAFNEQ